MRNKAKKLAVLERLRGQTDALSLRELLALLPPEFAERSVRRWLSELVAEGLVGRTGRKRGTRYRAMPTEAPGAGVDSPPTASAPQRVSDFRFSQMAEESVAHVRRPIFQRQPVAYRAEWLAAYEPNRTTYFPPGATARLAALGTRTPIGDPAGTYARRIYNRLLIDLSHHSSRLEGNTYSLLDTERLVIQGKAAAGKLDIETVMILNHKEAIRHLVEQSARRGVSYDEILTLHFLLADALLPAEHCGLVRDHGVRIGGSTYMPFEDGDRLAWHLRIIAEKAAAVEDPYEQSLFLLIHIAYLQAFADVNKRTSRLCANIPLLQRNVVPLSFNAVDTDDYVAAALAIYELNDPRPMAELYAASYQRTCAEYDTTVEASGIDIVRVRHRQLRRQTLAEIIANVAVGDALAERIEMAAAQVPQEDRPDFIADLNEDLAALSPARIAGLGITQQQLQDWLARRSGGAVAN